MSLIKMMTTRNVGTLDRITRSLPAIATAWLWWSGAIGGPVAVLAAIFAAMLLATSVTGSCSIYYLLGFSTCPVSGKAKPQV